MTARIAVGECGSTRQAEETQTVGVREHLFVYGTLAPGHVFTSDFLTEHWKRLDEFQGEGYEPVVAEAHLCDGSPVSAHLYVARGLAAH